MDAHTNLGPLGIAWLVVLFVGILIWAFRPWIAKRRRRHLDDSGGGTANE